MSGSSAGVGDVTRQPSPPPSPMPLPRRVAQDAAPYQRGPGADRIHDVDRKARGGRGGGAGCRPGCAWC
eukprot:365856-Chlamydomonas_euryale.AAC.20